MTLSTKEKLIRIYNLMFDYAGKQNWWPADTDLEICIGAILTQNINWTNAHKAICKLKENNALDLSIIQNIDPEKLANMIRSSGYYNQKVKKLKNFANYVQNHKNGLDDLHKKDTQNLRNELLAINGIGPETADDILLYAFNRPVFVIDAYTKRIMSRHGICEINIKYEKLAEIFTNNLDNSIELFGEYHGLIVLIGKNFCKKTKPLCEKCPLESNLSEN